MKTRLLTLALLAALLTLLVCTASAAQPTSGSCGPNLNWNLDKATGVLTISGTGPMEDYGYSAVWYWTENRSYVQTIVVEEGCTTIGKTAFAQLSNLTSVTLPSTITDIGEEAFYGDKKLTSVTMAGAASLGPYCFRNCTALTEIVFPEGLQSIGHRCFMGCTALDRVVFPGSLDTVDVYLFIDCNALQTVEFGDGFTGEGCAAGAFMGRQHCRTEFHLPDSFCNASVQIFDASTDVFYARTGSTAALTLGRLGLSFTDPAGDHMVSATYLFDGEGN